MNKQILIILIFGIIFLGLVTAQEITRSCQAQYVVKVVEALDVDGRPISGTYPTYAYPFSGKGTVGYYNPNEARRRARDIISMNVFNMIGTTIEMLR